MIQMQIYNNCDMNDRVLKLIKEKDLSINGLARIVGMNQSNLSMQFNGSRKLSLETIVSLLNAFSDISAEWLLRGEGNMLRTATSNDTSAVSDEKVKDVAYWKHVALSMSEEVTEKKDRIKELERELQRLGDELDQRLLKEERRGASGKASKTA